MPISMWLVFDYGDCGGGGGDNEEVTTMTTC
jgi:hypothetical protein